MNEQDEGSRKIQQEQRAQQEAARREQEAQQAQQAREAQQYAQQQRAQEQANRQQEQQQRQQEQAQRSKEQQDKRTDPNKKQDDKHDDHQDATRSRQEQKSAAGEHQRPSSAADSLNGPAKHPDTERSSTQEHKSDDKSAAAQTGAPSEQPPSQRDGTDKRDEESARATTATTEGQAGAGTNADAQKAQPAEGQHSDAHTMTGGPGETTPPQTGAVLNRADATDGRTDASHANGGQHNDQTNGAHGNNADATFAQSIHPNQGEPDDTLRRILDFTGEGDDEPAEDEHERPPLIGHGSVQPAATQADADSHDAATNTSNAGDANASFNPPEPGHKYGPPEEIHFYPPGTNASHDPSELQTRTEGARDVPVVPQRNLPHTLLDGSPANAALSAGDPTRVQPAPTTPPASPSVPDHGAAQSLAGRHSAGRDAVIAAAMAGFDGNDPAEEQTTPEIRAFERIVHDAGPGARRPTLALPTDHPSPTGVILEASRQVSTIDQVHERWGVTSKADLAAAARNADDHLNTSLSADERTRYESEAGEIRQEALSRALPYVPSAQLHQISVALHAVLTELQSFKDVPGATQALRSLAVVDHEIDRRAALPREAHAPRASLISTWSASANRHIYGDRTDDGAEIGRGITRAVVGTLNLPALVADGIVQGYHAVHDPQTYDPAQHMTASSYTVIQTDNAGDDEALIRAGIDQAGSIAASLVPGASEGMAAVALIDALQRGDRGQIGEAGAGLFLTVAQNTALRSRSETVVNEPPRQLPGATVESPPRLPAGEGSSRSGGAGSGRGGPPLGTEPAPHDTLVDHPAVGQPSTSAGTEPVDPNAVTGVRNVELQPPSPPRTPEPEQLTPQQVQRIATQAAHGDPALTARVERAIEDLRRDPTVSFDSARHISELAHHVAEAARSRNITHVLSETEFSQAREQWRQRDMKGPGQTAVHFREFRHAYEYHLAGGEGEPPDGFRTDDNVTHILDDPATQRVPGPAAEPVDPNATTGLHNAPPQPPGPPAGRPPTTSPPTNTTEPAPHDTLVDHPAVGHPSTSAGTEPVDPNAVTGVRNVELQPPSPPRTPEPEQLTPQQVQRIATQAAHGDPALTARVERAIEDLRRDPTVSFDSARHISELAHHVAEAARSRNITHVLSETEFSQAREQWRQRDMKGPGQTAVHFREFRHAYEYHLAGGEGEPPDGFRTDDNVTHILDDPATQRVPGPAAEPVDPNATTGLHNAPPHPPGPPAGRPPTTSPPTNTTEPAPHDTLVDPPVPGGPRGGPGEPTPRDTIVTESHVTPDQVRQLAEAAANGDAHIAGRVERALHDLQGNRTIHFDGIGDVRRAAEYLAHQAGAREITQVFPAATARGLNEAWHHGATSFDHYGNVHFAILEAEHSFQWHLAGGEGTAPDAFRTADGIMHVRNADLPTPPGITATPQTYGDAPAVRAPVAETGASPAPVDPLPVAQLDASAANALGQTPAHNDALRAGTVAQPVNPSPPTSPAPPAAHPAGGTPPARPPAAPPPGRPASPAQPERPVAARDAARTERRLPAFFDDGEVLPRDQWGLNRNPPAERVPLNEVTSRHIGLMLDVFARLQDIDPVLADDYLRGLGIEPGERR